jgi:threonyl-tRNA synthetase
VQIVIIPIADRHLEYAKQICNILRDEDIRVLVDDRTERMNLKIREAQLDKIPYMVIVGDKELANTTVSVRLRNGEELGSKQLAEFKARVQTIIQAKDSEKL